MNDSLPAENPAPWLGLDIGGANLKFASSAGWSLSVPFPLWREPEGLPAALETVLRELPHVAGYAVTMTGELADCYASKAEGVCAIVSAVSRVCRDKPVWVWGVDGEFRTIHEALREPEPVAAANWLAQATWAGRHAPRGLSLLLDLGSTTTDMIPLKDGRPVSRGRTDLQRLQASELLYTGMRRTPICAVADWVLFRGIATPLAAELFATTADLYLLLGLLPPDPQDHQTADGRPATLHAARSRLARMLCCDLSEIGTEELQEVARELAGIQARQIEKAITQCLQRFEEPCQAVLLSGGGALLAERVVRDLPSLRPAAVVRLADLLTPGLAEAACAYGVSVLISEQSTRKGIP